MSTELRKKALLEALEKCLGVVTTACRMVKIDRSTHYEWYKIDPDYKKAVDDLENVALDYAESKLHKNIEKGKETSIIFYMKTKGKKRGYVELYEHREVPGEQPMFGPEQESNDEK